jgi:uncharacterized membrane protein
LESLFEFLFKYRPVVFEHGHLAFGAGWLTYVVVLLALAVGAVALWAYGRVRIRGGRFDRAILMGLRTLAVALVAVALFRPQLVLSSAVPQRNVVALLVDDSRSMKIADVGGRTRADVVRQLLGSKDSTLYKALAEKFLVRLFRFSSTGDQAGSVAELGFDGARTQLGPALEGVRQELNGVPVSGLVVVSDGADNATTSMAEPLLSLAARRLPVFTVGIGQDRFARDIEISRVEAPRTVLQGSSLVVNVTVVQRGFRGEKVQLVVEDSGQIVGTQDVVLSSDGEAAPVRVRVPTTQPGARVLTFRIAPQSGEMVTQNNAQQALVTVRSAKEKILYVEGEPRPELKFLRRAVENDKNLQIVTIVRTATDKYLRMSVDDSLEMLAGFPKTREELFGYRGIILGSIEASYFTLDQLRMLADFVSERGGGLLMLGGRQSFAEGGYAGTPLADVLPVELTAPHDAASQYFAELTPIAPTPAGASHAATQIAPSESASVSRWKTMPPVTSVNRISRLKPGATTLLTGTTKGATDRNIVLAYQRYGRGKAIALPVQDTWMWQMEASVEVDDLTHESFWRQLLRWLVTDVPGRVEVAIESDRVAPNETVPVRATVNDRTYIGLNSATAKATVLAPSGAVTEIPLEWSVTRDGEYVASFTPTERGVHRVQVRATAGADTITADPVYIDATDLTNEYFGAEMRRPLLRRIAEETGGKFYTPQSVAALPRDLVYSSSGSTVVQRLDLWDMPIVLVVLLGLLAGEWGYRRARGLA